MRTTRPIAIAIAFALACAPAQRENEPAIPEPNIDPGRVDPPRVVVPEPEAAVERIVPPETALVRGWMALASTGTDRFLREHPTLDGRGVLIAILDTGIDPGIPGFSTTSTGNPKLLDLRDFSGEGAVPLRRVVPSGDTVEVAGRRLGGFGRVVALNSTGPYYAGTLAEIPLGEAPAADLDADGTVRDTFPIVVTRATDGWVMLADTDGNRSFAGERAVHDYLRGRETFGWAAAGRTPRATVAANLTEAAGVPSLTLVFDISGHGSHVAGIAAAHQLYRVPGFDGVAPGAQLLGLKIANSAQGGISTTGSMLNAIGYAVRFADARRLPLVINLSFGVGNEIEGGVRIDALVDSALRRNPHVTFIVSAGNDGPGLSTVGFPGSARDAITIGATLPSSFLPRGGDGGAARDEVAYFSSRGGELAKPDVLAPGMAYSTVPLWNAGDEIKQGTSMAAPHAAGVTALLVSALTQRKKPVVARTIKQALMVTARPTAGATYVDEGRGLIDVGAAHAWLEREQVVPEIQVRAAGAGLSAAWIQTPPGQPAADGVQVFEVSRAASTAPASYTLRSDAPWLTAPLRVTLSAPVTKVALRYIGARLAAPGAHTGTVTAWSADTLAGPAFRLVTTVVTPAPVAVGGKALRPGARVAAGGLVRSFFEADTARPFEVRVSSEAERALAFLHEPDGMPYRDQAGRTAGQGAQAAVYQADARDVVGGAYEVVAVAPPSQSLTASVLVTHAPLTLHAGRGPAGVMATLGNPTSAPVTAELSMALAGGERLETVSASGSAMHRIPFTAPAWATGIVVDVSMDREQWGRFTDFGVTLYDSVGRPLGKQPLNYAFGRLQVELPRGHADMPVVLGLQPGFADPAGDQRWALRAAMRLYADTAVALAPADSARASLTIAPGTTASASFVAPPSPWPLGDGFSLLGALVARTGGHIWTRETSFPPSASGAAR